ncbi:MAG: methyltransferase domain-containing protein [Patescibacteria group bacterium]|jgi:SAM-dependent methyltransferase
MIAADLGCGVNKTRDTIGIDRFPLDGVDVVVDLQKFPYPFADNSFDAFYLNDIIEHLPDTVAVMEELYRLCKPDAHLYIRVINWNSKYNAEDPTHVKMFTEHTFDFFGTYALRSYYSKARFKVLSCEYQFNASVEKWLKSRRLMKFLGTYLNNISEGLHFDLQCVKETSNVAQKEYDLGKDIFSIIRCPFCVRDEKTKGTATLHISEKTRLVCNNKDCGRTYEIKNGTPILTLLEK